MKPKKETVLVGAASALEEELARWEQTVLDARRLEPTSDKTLDRAKQLLEGCASFEQKMAEQLHAFVTAMQAVQERQRACMAQTMEVAQKLKERIESRQALLERFTALGQRAGTINEPVAIVMDALGRKAPAQELLAPLDDVVAKTNEVAAEAESVEKEAREKNWQDIAREADALKQQIRSVRDKVVNAHRGVAQRAPS